MNTSSLTAGVLNNVVQSNPLRFYKTLQWKCHIIALALEGDSQQDLVSMGPIEQALEEDSLQALVSLQVLVVL